jgi:hypothetical protein
VTRFDAADADERRALFADAVTAHRTRGSRFLTVEATLDADGDGEFPPTDGDPDGADDDASGTPPPWVQFAGDTFNLDCTDAELDRLTALVDDYPEFRIDGMESPESAEGTNVRVTARSDAARLASFLERAFREVYDRPADYRAWVVRV